MLSAGAWADIGTFRVPQLRGLAARPPYFHDGQAKNIKEAITYHELKVAQTPAGWLAEVIVDI